jgi:hypothetical protein
MNQPVIYLSTAISFQYRYRLILMPKNSDTPSEEVVPEKGICLDDRKRTQKDPLSRSAIDSLHNLKHTVTRKYLHRAFESASPLLIVEVSEEATG